MESIGSFSKNSPVTEQRSVFTLVANQIISHYSDTNTCRSHVLLCPSIDHSILGPVDRLTAEVRWHIADQCLTSRHPVMRKLGKFKALNRLVVTVMEILCVCIDIPFWGVSYSGIFWFLVICNLSRATVFFYLCNSSLRPGAGCQVVCFRIPPFSKEVESDCTELQRGSTLEEEDCVVFWDAEQFSEIIFRFFCDWNEVLSSMTHFHDTHASAIPVHELILSFF